MSKLDELIKELCPDGVWIVQSHYLVIRMQGELYYCKALRTTIMDMSQLMANPCRAMWI